MSLLEIFFLNLFKCETYQLFAVYNKTNTQKSHKNVLID